MAVGDPEEKQRGWNLHALFTCALAAAYFVSIFHEARIRFAWDLPATDVVTLLLAGAGLTLTAVGIFVAILAFWGWRNIKRDSIAAARLAAQRAVQDYLVSPAAARTIDRSVVAFLQQNPQTLVAFLAESREAQRNMSELDEPEVDGAWGADGDGEIDRTP